MDLPRPREARGVSFPHRVDSQDHRYRDLLGSEPSASSFLAGDAIEKREDEGAGPDVFLMSAIACGSW